MGISKRERWTEDDVLALPLGEHDYFERKSGALLVDTDFRNDLAKALSALSNSGGGHLILGVRDDGTFDGVPRFKGKKRISEWLEQIMPEMLSYPLQDFRVHEVERADPTAIPTEKVLIVIDVGDTSLAPHQSSVNKVYYYRVGGHSLPAPHFYLETLRGRDNYPGPAIVSAWFETVLNPLLNVLKYEQLYLAQGRWTWKSYPGSLTELKYLTARPHYTVSENQEQLLEQHLEIAILLEKHDKGIDTFRSQITKLYEAVMTSPELEGVYREKTSSAHLREIQSAFQYKLGKYDSEEEILSELFTSSDPAVHLDVLARHIVNNEADLGVGFTSTAPFWNTYRQEFFAVLSAPALANLKGQLEQAKEELVQLISSLIKLLTDTRRELAHRHRVPYQKSLGRGAEY